MPGSRNDDVSPSFFRRPFAGRRFRFHEDVPMSLRAAITEFLTNEHLPSSFAPDDDLVRVPGTSPENEWVMIMQWSESLHQVTAYSVSTRAVPLERRQAVMELITRANFGLHMGCFELDLEDGELRVRASIDFEGEHASPSLVRNTFFAALSIMRAYLPAVAAAVEGASPKDALTRVERSE